MLIKVKAFFQNKNQIVDSMTKNPCLLLVSSIYALEKDFPVVKCTFIYKINGSFPLY